ncbi:MAG: TetR/AcrR family transcriptional regulator [Solirubrobacterales bacterium]
MSKSDPAAGSARLICRTMLEVVGEVGYAQATVEEVIGRGACSRSCFYQHFSSKEDCFRVAYREEAEGLCTAMLDACEPGADWTRGLIEGLRRLLGFVSTDPAIALALLVESHGNEETVTAAQRQVVERLTRALDGARRQPGSRHSAPPSTATLMIGAVENLLRGLLVSGESERAPTLLGDLTYLIVQSYFGEDAAFAAMDAAKAT